MAASQAAFEGSIPFTCSIMRIWRNWQTRRSQTPMGNRASSNLVIRTIKQLKPPKAVFKLNRRKFIATFFIFYLKYLLIYALIML